MTHITGADYFPPARSRQPESGEIIVTTTNLFVELVVIGVGAACWLCLLICGVFGVDVVAADVLQPYPVLVALLAVVYLLGIISDRIADFVFDKLFSSRLREIHFNDKRDYQDSRRLVFNRSGRLADMHDYGRTRIRICRGWALNALIIAISLNVFLHNQSTRADWHQSAQTWGTSGCLLLSAASWWSWRLLCLTEYLKIKEHAEFLRSSQRSDASRIAA